MERAVMVVDGSIRLPLFRSRICRIARSRRVVGYVKNRDDGSLEIIAEGYHRDLNLVADDVRNNPDPGLVTGIQVSHEKATGEFGNFRIKYGDPLEELAVTVAAGAPLSRDCATQDPERASS